MAKLKAGKTHSDNLIINLYSAVLEIFIFQSRNVKGFSFCHNVVVQFGIWEKL